MAPVQFFLEHRMREALFFLSLTMLVTLYGVLGYRWGVLVALTLLVSSFWILIIQSRRTFFNFGTMLLVCLILYKGVSGAALSRHMLVSVTIATITLVLAYSGTSSDVDIAPTFAVFVAIMLFLHTFLHLAIPLKFCFGAIIFLTIASVVDDWNARRRLPELEDEVPCRSE